jgi:hypothetical protein
MKHDPNEISEHYKSVLMSHCIFSLESWHLLESILEIKEIGKSELSLHEGKTCRLLTLFIWARLEPIT